MGYLIKSDVMGAIQEDRKTSLMCYKGEKPIEDIINFCYDSVEREIDRLIQYRVENVTDSDTKHKESEVIRNGR